MESLRHLMMSGGFLPHGYCYLWTPGLVELHVVSDALIAISYLTIPVTMVYFIRKRRDIPFSWMFLCFGVFIVACGTTHLMEIWTIWFPAYWLSGAVKAFTACVSAATAILLIRVTPKINGPSVLRTLRDDPRTRAIPVIILTSSKEEKDVAKGYDLGVNSYIQKPVDFVQFRKATHTLGLYWLVFNQGPPRHTLKAIAEKTG